MELHAVFADPASDNKAVVGQLFVISKTNRIVAKLLTWSFAAPINVAGAGVRPTCIRIADDAAL